jgi:glycine betaine/proline transport system permease protein
MSFAIAETPGRPLAGRWSMAWMAALLLAYGLYNVEELVPWAAKYPRGWVLPLSFWISDFMKWLINDATFGLFTFKQLTRSIAWLLTWPLEVAEGLLASGFKLVFGADDEIVYQLPRLSWVAIVAVVGILGNLAGGRRLGLLMGACFLYLAVFGQWDSAMTTLASIMVAVPLGVATGLLIGIWGSRSPRRVAMVTPLLDLMQTVPVFAYLVPVLYLFGFGPVAAMIATMIYSVPPMVRCTLLALKLVPAEIVEFGRMAGCSPRQLMWKVMIPASRPTLMVGVNQVIMLSLNMVIIASMIGAGGLGFDVLTSLRRLAIGNGLEAGIAITLLAIALDRISQAFAAKPPPEQRQAAPSFLMRHPHFSLAMVIVVVTTGLGLVVPAFQSFPEQFTLTTGPFWDASVKWININYFDQIDAVKSFLLINILIPFKRFLLDIPWPAGVGLIALAGYQLGGRRLALLVAAMALFIVVTGNWPKAMISTYLIGISVVIASIIGIPIGIWAAGNDRVHNVVQVAIDTLQTIPAFVYLIPVVMLFRVGDFSAMIAVVAYSLVPAIRYTDHGIRQVPQSIIEAATAAGCTRWQSLRKVKLRLALPEIMLGVNQTVMMGLSMLVITALVGTRDLGQEVYIALTKADSGRGLVAGASVACIAMITDRLISAWSQRRKRELGLD